MRKLYYAFEWVIRPMREIYMLINKDPNLDYDLALMNYVLTDNDNITSRVYVIEVDSLEVLREFQMKIGLKLDVTNWRISSHREFQRGTRFPELFEDFGYTSWIDGTMSVGRFNLARIDQIPSQRYGTYFYFFMCDWLITEEHLRNFAYVHDEAAKSGLLFYQYGHYKKNDCRYSRIGIRALSENHLREFIEKFGKLIGLTDWQPMKHDNFYTYGLKFAYLYSVENFISENQQYAAENERLGSVT